MNFWRTTRAKLFFLFVLVGLLPLLVHLLINYFFYSDLAKTESFFSYAREHILNNHHTLYHEVIVTLLLSFFIAIYITKPLRILEKIIKQLKDKPFTKKINFKSKDEVGRLSNVLNEILKQFRLNQKNLESRSQNILDSEKKHKELINLFADAIYEVDAHQRIVKVKNAEEVFGYTEKELIGKKSLEVVHKNDRKQLTQALEKVTANNNRPIRDLKIRILTKTGDIRYCLLSNRSIFKNGKLVRREGVLRDITPREILAQKVVKEKEKLEKMYQNLHDSYLALGKINAQVAALTEINTTFSSNLSWENKLHYIIESIKTFMQANEALLFVLDKNDQNLNIKYASVDFDFWFDVKLTKRMKLVKELIKKRQPLKFFEMSNLFDKTKASTKGYQAMLAIPVVINSEVIGIFIVFFSDSQKLKDFPTRLALAYTSQMSIALMMSGNLNRSTKKIA